MLKIDLRPVRIYALTEPDTGAVRYVGRSVGLAARYATHAGGHWSNPPEKRAWTLALKGRGQAPGLQVLGVCGWGVADAEEKRWIEHYRQAGAELFNGGLYRNGYHNRPPRRKLPKRYPVHLRLTEPASAMLTHLAESRGLNRGQWLDLAIRAEAKREGLVPREKAEGQ